MRRKREFRPVLPDETYTVTVRRDHATGVVVHERWEQNGQEHREHGPALVWCDPVTGVAVNEKWVWRGKLHREDGPADILRNPGGRIYYSAWYKHGEKVPAPRPARSGPKHAGRQMGPGSGAPAP